MGMKSLNFSGHTYSLHIAGSKTMTELFDDIALLENTNQLNKMLKDYDDGIIHIYNNIPELDTPELDKVGDAITELRGTILNLASKLKR